MVAYPSNPGVDIYRSLAGCWWRICCSTIYLYTILIRKRVQNQDRYKTMLVIVTGLLVVALIFNISWLITVAMVVGLVTAFIPIAAKGVEWFWFKLAFVLGWVNSRILLSIIYFAFLLPIAWLSRLFTKDPLALRKRKTSTLFVERNHLYTKKDLENIW
jgi:hypothetical protein